MTLLSGDEFAPDAPYSDDALAVRVGRIETLTEPIGRAAAEWAYWVGPTDRRLGGAVIARLANAFDRSEGLVPWLQLRLYPALLVTYASGVAAVIGKREDILADLLIKPSVRDHSDWKPAAVVINVDAALEKSVAQKLPGLERRHTPVSDHVVEAIRPWLADLERDDEAFERAFDRFEYLLGLVMFDLRRDGPGGGWAPAGRFTWRGKHGKGIDAEISAEAAQTQASWPLLAAGLFKGDADRLTESLAGWNQLIAEVRNHQW